MDAQFTEAAIAEDIAWAALAAPRPSETEEWAPYTTPPTKVPPLLDSRAGLSDELLSQVDGLEALILEAERLGCLHSAAEVDGVEGRALEKAELRWQAMRDRAARARLALLDRSAPAVETMTRASAFLRASALETTRRQNWKKWTPAQAAGRVGANGSDIDLAPLVKFLMRSPASAPAAVSRPTTAWDAAKHRLQMERRWLDANRGADTPDSYFAAEKAVLFTPAPDGAALAYKIGTLSISDDTLSDPAAGFDVVHGEFRNRAALDAAAAAWRGDEPRAMLSFYDDALRLGAGAGPRRPDTSSWESARARFHAANDAYNACDPEADEAAGDLLWNAMCESLGQWEGATPPDAEALAEVIRVSLNTIGLSWKFSDMDSSDTLSDMIDQGGDTALLAKVYVNLLRMTGSTSPAAAADLSPRGKHFDPDGAEGEEIGRRWSEHVLARRAKIAAKPVDAPAAPHPDAELFRAAEEHEKARRAWHARIDQWKEGEGSLDKTPEAQANDAAYWRLTKFRASTPEGLVALTTQLRHTFTGNMADPSTFDPGEVPLDDLNRAVCDSALALSTPAPTEDPDQALVDLGARFLALRDQIDAIELSDTYPSAGDAEAAMPLHVELSDLFEQSRRLRATTQAGLQVKARMADYWQPNSDADDFNDLHWQLARSLIIDAIGDEPSYLELHKHPNTSREEALGIPTVTA